MKKLLLPLLLVLLLAGCQKLYPDEDIYVSEHVAPFAYRETRQMGDETHEQDLMQTVKCASDIRREIKRMLIRGDENGTFRLENYDGNVNADMKDMYYALRNDSPKYAYALGDQPSWNVIHQDTDRILKVHINIQKDVQAIQTSLYKKDIFEEEIFTALRQMISSYTVEVSGYQDTDWNSLLDQYVLEHPDQIVEAPSISVYVFPDRGTIRVLELHFDYNTDHDTLLQRKNETDSYLNRILNQLLLTRPEEMVETLSKYLIPGTNYIDDPDATVYTQVSLTGGSSRTMASVAAYLCKLAGAECEIVVGEREGSPWYWNRIMIDGHWRSFDLHASALAGNNHPSLLRSDEMVGYTWNPEFYPEVEEPEPVAPSEPDEPGESTEPTEPTEPTESSETTDATEPTEPFVTEPPLPTESTEASTEVP